MTIEVARQNRRLQLQHSDSRPPASIEKEPRKSCVTHVGTRRFAALARSLMLMALAACVIALSAPCLAQEDGADPPTPSTTGNASGSVFAPSAWLVLNTALQERVDLKIYGFYIGELGVPVAQIDLPIRAAKYLTITPSYMYYRAPASGLNKLTLQPGQFTESYEESQLRIDGTVAFPIHKLEMSVRGMYVRRFRPTPAEDINRYRTRIAVAYPLTVQGRVWKPFASYETAYERSSGWSRDRLWAGVTVPVNKRLSVQPSYMWERSDGTRDIHYLLFGLIVKTR